MSEGELWSWVRSVMAQGACIQQDYASGLVHMTYEAYSARLDMAAAERADQLLARLNLPPQIPNEFAHMLTPEALWGMYVEDSETPNAANEARP